MSTSPLLALLMPLFAYLGVPRSSSGKGGASLVGGPSVALGKAAKVKGAAAEAAAAAAALARVSGASLLRSMRPQDLALSSLSAEASMAEVRPVALQYLRWLFCLSCCPCPCLTPNSTVGGGSTQKGRRLRLRPPYPRRGSPGAVCQVEGVDVDTVDARWRARRRPRNGALPSTAHPLPRPVEDLSARSARRVGLLKVLQVVLSDKQGGAALLRDHAAAPVLCRVWAKAHLDGDTPAIFQSLR